MALSDEIRAAIKAKAYVLDIVAGLVPSDPEFNEIWAVIPDYALMDAAPADIDFIELAEKIRALREKHFNARLDRQEA